MNKAGNLIEGKRVRAKFEPEEDEALKNLVQKYGENNWNTISSFMPNRNIRQCRERWSHYLCSETAKRPWTPEEDALLLSTVHDIGTKWCKVINHLKDRTDIQAKTRWLHLTHRKTVRGSPKEEFEIPKPEKEILTRPMPQMPIQTIEKSPSPQITTITIPAPVEKLDFKLEITEVAIPNEITKSEAPIFTENFQDSPIFSFDFNDPENEIQFFLNEDTSKWDGSFLTQSLI